MPLAITTQSFRLSRLRSALESILGYLRSDNVESAGKALRLLVDRDRIPRQALVASQEESAGSKLPALPIAALGARIALQNKELQYAVDFARTIQQCYGKTSTTISPTIVHITTSLIEIGSSDSLSYATELIESTKPELLPPDLIQKFYYSSLDRSALIQRVWNHTQHSSAPRPSGAVLVNLLNWLDHQKDFGPMIYLVTQILKGQAPDAQSLPPEIPIEHAPQVIALSARAGASQQSFRLWELASLQVGYPKTPATLEQAQFFGNAGMTYSLVRHFMKLAEKNPTRLRRWHSSQLEQNPKKFSQNAERVYDAFALVHGFDQESFDSYLRADHYQVATSIACLFALNRFVPALDALNAFFRRNELPDDKDFGIILAALARRNAVRATQVLLEAAPARIPGFTPTPFLYNIVLHHALLQNREDTAERIMVHARDSGCGSLDPKSLDVLLRSAIKKLKKSHRNDNSSEEAKASRSEQYHLFKRIFEVLNAAQHHAHPSTYRLAIQTALKVERPTTAWEIWMLGKKYRRVGTARKGEDWKDVQQEDFGPGSSWHIAKGLWSAKEKGSITENQMWKMVESMKVRIPEGVKLTEEWAETITKVRENELPEPKSLRSKSSNV
ncbi:hypothetical protein RhiJN_06815 [Ceratobasidium sp. AG-Ba]|nr:hypothetical protein RhiJN_06815 [Ceratobasidium sp. AG-Ba]QRW07729.1 hypothetical protein RhiLY_06728 [Ceratobasidium sp. AG-Ba]